MNHCPIRGISLNYVTEGKWYLPSVGRSYFIRDSTGVSLVGSAFFLFCFEVFCFFHKAASAGSSIIWSSRGKVPPQNILRIWLHETNYLFYVLRIRLVILCHLKNARVVGPQVSCRSSVLKHLPQCQRFCFLIFFLIKPSTETYRGMSDLWPVCSTAGTGSLAASCGSNLPFCHVLFAPHTWLREKKGLWILSSEILPFIPALKCWGVLQGWWLILAAFVHSGLGKFCML